MTAQRQSSSRASPRASPREQWDLLNQVLDNLLEHTEDISHIKERFALFDRMEQKLDKVLQAVNDNQLKNLQRFGDQEVKIARIEERVSQRATMITTVGSIITLIAAGVVAFLQRDKTKDNWRVIMIFEHQIKENKEAFVKKVIEVAGYLGVKPEHLMFLMWFETAHTLDHRIQNKIGATGLIQFLPSTARFLGTTTKELKAMSNLEQMEYVKKHLGIFRGRYRDFVDLYCGIFYPKAVGHPDTYRITSDMIARQNPLFDINKDLDIEKAEIRKVLLKQVPAEYREYFI